MEDYLNNLKIIQNRQVVEIPIPSGFDKIQTYQDIGGHQRLRTLSGKAIKQSHWTKLRTEISARGIAPNVLSDLDYSKPMEIYCIAPRGLMSLRIGAVYSYAFKKLGRSLSDRAKKLVSTSILAGTTFYYRQKKNHKLLHQINDSGRVYLETEPDCYLYDLFCFGANSYKKSGGYQTPPAAMLMVWPIITCYCEFRETSSNDASNWSWTLICEEV